MRGPSLGLALAAVLAGTTVAGATTVTVNNVNAAGVGFNDTTPAAPVGGNPMTTLGAQRLYAFEYAANIWEGLLDSPVEIKVDARMSALFCTGSGAVLGEAGPEGFARNFTGAPLPDTWYASALADKLAGTDVDPGNADIGADFNSAIGTTCSFPMDWYYGVDGSPGVDQIDFASVVLHELGHGLGFGTLVNLASGAKFGGDDEFMVHLEDHSTGKTWPIMSNAERATSAVDTGDLHWLGPIVVAHSGALTAGRHAPSGHVEMYAPGVLQSGSSVSHWSTSLSPDELMEPFYPGPNHDVGLALHALCDLGWCGNCGDGVIDGGEGCDDENTSGGDGCSATCEVEACYGCTGAPSTCTPLPDDTACSDGDACTQTDTCLAAVCVGANPVTCTALDQCHVAGACNPSTGLCSDPKQPDGTSCDDSESCTTTDECTDGVCAGTVTCVDTFLCYKDKIASGTTPFGPETGVSLAGDFESLTVDAQKPKYLCAPADEGGGVADTATHLEAYKVKVTSGAHTRQIGLEVSNMVGGVQPLDVSTVKPDFILVPTATDPTMDPAAPAFGSHEVDHYECYKAKVTSGTTKFPKGVQIALDDQFTSGAKTFDVKKPTHLCLPVSLNGSGVKHGTANLMCYKAKPALGQPRHSAVLGLHANNAFGPERLNTVKEDVFCTPSRRQ